MSKQDFFNKQKRIHGCYVMKHYKSSINTVKLSKQEWCLCLLPKN